MTDSCEKCLWTSRHNQIHVPELDVCIDVDIVSHILFINKIIGCKTMMSCQSNSVHGGCFQFVIESSSYHKMQNFLMEKDVVANPFLNIFCSNGHNYWMIDQVGFDSSAPINIGTSTDHDGTQLVHYFVSIDPAEVFC